LSGKVSGLRPPRALSWASRRRIVDRRSRLRGAFWGADPTFGPRIFPVALALQALWSALWRLYLGRWLRVQASVRWLVIGNG